MAPGNDVPAGTGEEAPAPPRANLEHGAVTYDANHNLVICRFGGRGKFWFYRHKGGCPTGAFLAPQRE